MSEHVLRVDCTSCVARGPACDDCVISVLLGRPSETVELDRSEQVAIAALAEEGLVPPLRLLPGARRVLPLAAPFDWSESG